MNHHVSLGLKLKVCTSVKAHYLKFYKYFKSLKFKKVTNEYLDRVVVGPE